jgi:flagellar hook protein FlgE
MSGSAEQVYTRAGNFDQDFLGNLRNNAGFFLRGWALDANEQVVDIDVPSTVNVRIINSVAAATSQVEIGADIDAGGTACAAGDMANYAATGGVSGVQSPMLHPIQVFDPLGGPHNSNVASLEDPNTWNVEILADRAEVRCRRPPWVAGHAGEGGAGFISPSSLEGANVDLAGQSTEMMVTRRACSANARVITSADEILDELIHISH